MRTVIITIFLSVHMISGLNTETSIQVKKNPAISEASLNGNFNSYDKKIADYVFEAERLNLLYPETTAIQKKGILSRLAFIQSEINRRR